MCRGGKKLDNIVLRSEWFDESEKFCEVRLTCETKFLTIYHVCYLFEDEMTKILLTMDDYIENPNLVRKIIFGDDRGGGSGYFVFTFAPINVREELNIEVNMEVADNDEGLHRCQFYVKTQLENLKHFRNHLPRIFSKDYKRAVTLHDEQTRNVMI